MKYPFVFRIVFALAALAILAYAAWQRFTFPLLPSADPDTWGYLNPALTALSGEGFVQTHGRSFLYPVFLWSILSTTASFHAIVIAQHLASLATGIVWLGLIAIWCSFLPESWTRRLLAPAFGLITLACYLLSSETVIFGTRIRPEALFPLIALLQIFFLFLFIKVRWGKGPQQMACLLSGALAFLFAVAAYNLKPSWGFSFLLSPLVLLYAAVFHREGRSLLTAFVPLVAGGLSAVCFLFAIPKIIGWKADERAGTFLPMVLFSVHADLISDHLEKKAASTEEKEFSARLAQGITESRKQLGPYEALGFNPDYLMFGSKVLTELPGVHNAKERKAFYFKHYLGTLGESPLRFTQKWATQLGLAWFPEGKFLARSKGPVRKYFERVNVCLVDAPPQLRPDVAANYQATRQEVLTALDSLPENKVVGPQWLKAAGNIGVVFYAPLALFIIVMALVVSVTKNTAIQNLRRAVWCAVLVVAAAFLSSLTVAVIHTFDIDRYLYLQAFTAWLTIACGGALVCLLLEIGLHRLLAQGLPKEMVSSSPKT